MKIKLIFCLIIIQSFLTFSQENVKLCSEYQAKINDFITKNNYTEAEKTIQLVLKSCPSANENFYQNAEKIYLHNIEFSNTNDLKIQVIKNLIKIYDASDKRFPENKNGNAIKKALYIYDNKLEEKSIIFNILDNSYKSNNADFSNPRAFYIYYELYVYEFKNGKNGIKIEDLISKYISINDKNIDFQKSLISTIEILREKQKTSQLSDSEKIVLKSKIEDLQAFELVQEASKELLEPYLSCENLKIYANDFFEANMKNDSWLKFISSEMFNKGCYSNEIFNKIVLKSNEINPTTKSNFYLGYVEILKNDLSKAESYFIESVNLESNALEKANIYFTIANVVFGVNNNYKFIEYLKKSIASDSNFAKPYLSLAQLYEANIDKCAQNEFEKKAIYWLIITNLEKAILAEPYLKTALQKQISEFQKKLPTAATISNLKMKGKTITFGCFINETIEIP
ncbi:MAG: hypothetical protein H7174_09605 [Flavobacterium sp.]|nr:hypothetical protein [Flavobacterium sp.]